MKDTMNGYNIIREVGKGGMGSVFEAVGPDGSRVALKMMSAKAASNPEYRELFEIEVKSLKKLNHPFIVRILGEPFSDTSGNIYLPMEFIDGKTIAQTVQEKGPFEESRALEIFAQLLDTFSYIHNMGCIHRDVKPSNIMLRPEGTVCVIDFGIAKDSRTSTGKTIGRIIGTDGYMSPEQANGYNIDHRTDIYSLGCVLHFMLAGSHAIPKQSNDYDTICAILENNFPRVSDNGITVSRRTQDAILKAVDKNMTVRFQSAAQFKTALLPDGYDSDSVRVSVGRTQCDINMPGDYVSSHHLDIVFKFATGPTAVTIIDHSTNGTGVDGRLLRNDSYSFGVYDATSVFPQVMLAGLPQFSLDWSEVQRIVSDKSTGRRTKVREGNVTVDDSPTYVPEKKTRKLAAGYKILAFLIPPVGWILAGIWKKQDEVKSGIVFKYACAGFITNLVISLISQLISL